MEARKEYKNSFICASRIFKEEGIRTFWSGAVPRLARLILSGGIVFTMSVYTAQVADLTLTSAGMRKRWRVWTSLIPNESISRLSLACSLLFKEILRQPDFQSISTTQPTLPALSTQAGLRKALRSTSLHSMSYLIHETFGASRPYDTLTFSTCDLGCSSDHTLQIYLLLPA